MKKEKNVYSAPEMESVEIVNDIITSSSGFFGDDLDLGSLYTLPEFPPDTNSSESAE